MGSGWGGPTVFVISDGRSSQDASTALYDQLQKSSLSVQKRLGFLTGHMYTKTIASLAKESRLP